MLNLFLLVHPDADDTLVDNVLDKYKYRDIWYNPLLSEFPKNYFNLSPIPVKVNKKARRSERWATRRGLARSEGFLYIDKEGNYYEVDSCFSSMELVDYYNAAMSDINNETKTFNDIFYEYEYAREVTNELLEKLQAHSILGPAINMLICNDSHMLNSLFHSIGKIL